MTSVGMMSQCLISFGSNLGDRHARIADAARIVGSDSAVHSLRTSRLFETPPIGGPSGQEPFLNAVGAFETTASARQILTLLQTVEERLGRQRRQRWDSRSIDLDVVLHGALVGGGTGLIVPHPRYTARQFVLRPACDVAPDYRDPRFGWTVRRLADHLDRGVPSLALVGGDEQTRSEICERLRDRFGIKTFAAQPLAQPMSVVGNAPAAAPVKPIIVSGEEASDPEPTVGRRQHPVDRRQGVVLGEPQPWVSEFVPPLPPLDSPDTDRDDVPRLVARLQSTTAESRWPAPHQMWPAGWQWPEYRLEMDDLTWAASEVASALTSMRCPLAPVTDDGSWW